MTCPPDAFNSGVDVIRLEPGEVHQAAWSIFAL
jgi:aldose 1-epimerase